MVILLTACGKREIPLPTVTGTKYEILVVINDAEWKTPTGRSLVTLFDRNMEGLPQPEAVMNITRCSRIEFTDKLKSSRNIILTEIVDKNTKPKVIYTQNKWAQPQSVVRILAANDSVFTSTLKAYGENILNFFLQTERERQIAFNKRYINKNAKTEIEKLFDIQIDITKDLKKTVKKKDFYWITNDNLATRQDIVIYSYPYTGKKTWTKSYLLAKRDSVMKANIPGEFEGSYMGTEFRFLPPTFTEISVNNSFCGEIRGLWKMINGGTMGGPFVSQTRLDEINRRVITIEGFVFAPGTKKRNPMRQLEAIIYSAKVTK